MVKFFLFYINKGIVLGWRAILFVHRKTKDVLDREISRKNGATENTFESENIIVRMTIILFISWFVLRLQ